MKYEEVLWRMKEHFIVHKIGDQKPHPLLEQAIPLAYRAIEKQIPKKPTLGGAYKINEWECPNCRSYFAELNDRPRHCVECGQAIDWSVEYNGKIL